ncbi:hypothetical protein GETHLI_23670 [Geothrix limicola]|uniref:Uncharacterized protein n=1 Tax=Geothrix limicola TaxID=2927978 RepID=A0ABQ5QI73_9BACT|nr:hypothetical protein [Geothrix limicola]GLH73865.1 hypothetical protein GETHLI_23670 [Geothrix limicola]
MKARWPALTLFAATAVLVAPAQETKVDKTKVKVSPLTQDTSGRPAPIQVTPPPPTGGTGARPARLVQPQLDDLETRMAALEALVEKQKAQVATLSSQVAVLQQDNNKLWAKNIALELIAKEYTTHQHNPGTLFGQTMQGNFHMVFVTDPNSLNARTSGPLPGK